ncbi:MAG: hypothetical protein ACOVP4_09555 [Bacteriovoracaceae bacterium]
MKIFLLSFLFIFMSCSIGVKETGGDGLYLYNPVLPYSSEDLQRRAPEFVKTARRDPSEGKLDELFAPSMPDIRKIGVISFEGMIQPTFGGLATQDSVYMSAAGKQIFTENLLRIWEQSLAVLGKDLTYVKVAKMNQAKTSARYGLDVNDYVLVKRNNLMPDDIFYVKKGKTTTSTALMNPRGMRDLSMVLVPAYQLMGGPKFSEAQKHYVNELCKEMGLDALLVIYSNIEWTARGVDKHKNDQDIPEEARLKVEASLIVPYSNYHARLDQLKFNGIKPQQTVTYRAYSTDVRIPVTITLEEEAQNFTTIEKNILAPVMDVYTQLTQMIISRMHDDVKKTF